jgi:hypothetical protein
MTGNPTRQESAAQEARYREAVAVANVPTLLPLLVQLTGEMRWLDGPYRPTRSRGVDDNPTGGLPEPIQTEIRAAVLESLLAWRAGAPMALPDPSDDLLVRMLSVSMGEPVPPEYGRLGAGSPAGLAGRPPDYDRSTRWLQRPDHRGRGLGHRRRDQAASRRHPLHGRREARDRGRDVVGEPLSRLRSRYAERPLFLLLRLP